MKKAADIINYVSDKITSEIANSNQTEIKRKEYFENLKKESATQDRINEMKHRLKHK